ncbi:cellulase family glycosylhydrolase [Priestia megaterium]|uniref:cellulase family glycosylhydrolase n=1 Tax=Priestia megaterium TaxID=1404 RepID=UPI0012B81773|nr:cellulase family glycosylhydrolase [Priestia megaterium]
MKKYNYLKSRKTVVFIIFTLILITFVCFFYFKIISLEENSEKKSKNKILFSNEIPKGFGVNIHFTGNRIDVDLIKDAGFRLVRKDVNWSELEKEKGIFDFRQGGYDQLTASLIDNGIQPYYILDYSNKLYEDNQSITTKQGEDAYIRYVSEVVSRYKNKGIIWEIWNEPNGGFWYPKPNIQEYSSLVKRASKAIKKNDPSGIVVAPALAGITPESLNWLEEIFKKNTLGYIDAVSVHPYRGKNPETVISDYKNLRLLIKKYTSKEIPILSGEWGYTTAETWMGVHVTEQQQAEYLVRMFLVNLLYDVPISVWYDWKNDGEDYFEPQHNFGLRENDTDVPKKAYNAMNTLTYNLSGFKLNKRINVDNPNDYILEFNNEKGDIVIVYWTTSNTHNVTIPLDYKSENIVNMYGKYIGNAQQNKINTLNISNEPRYIINE